MKIIIRIMTGIAALMLLFLGSLMEITLPSVIIAAVCIGWLALTGFATLRKERRNDG